MEPLALLCNLYGEGPSTQSRLQSVGFGTLEHLVSIDAEALSERTGWELDESADFLEHARALAERLGSGLLEHDAETASSGSALDLGDAAPGSSTSSGKSADAEAERRESVLATWRELDESEGEGPAPDLLVPQPPPTDNSLERGLALFAGELSEEDRERIIGLGVNSISEFVAASTLELARELELGFTRVRRLQLLASRIGDTLSTPGADSDSTPMRGEAEPGPGGPFA